MANTKNYNLYQFILQLGEMKLIYKTKSQYNGIIIQLAKETKQKSTDDGIVSEFVYAI